MVMEGKSRIKTEGRKRIKGRWVTWKKEMKTVKDK